MTPWDVLRVKESKYQLQCASLEFIRKNSQSRLKKTKGMAKKNVLSLSAASRLLFPCSLPPVLLNPTTKISIDHPYRRLPIKIIHTTNDQSTGFVVVVAGKCFYKQSTDHDKAYFCYGTSNDGEECVSSDNASDVQTQYATESELSREDTKENSVETWTQDSDVKRHIFFILENEHQSKNSYYTTTMAMSDMNASFEQQIWSR